MQRLFLALGLMLSVATAQGAVPVQLGPRPFFLVEDMADGPLKAKLQACAATRRDYKPTLFSIGHRGAALQFPEHTKESYEAAARMGAGIIECDVTFTKDKELVCRHAQNDLHTTTNILATPLAGKCIKPFTPAEFDAAGALVKPAAAECRTSELTLAEFKSLHAKMDAFNPRARNVAKYMAATPAWRTDLYTGPGTLMTLNEAIALYKKLGVKMTPELKAAAVTMPFDGFTQADYAQKMIDAHKAAGVPARDVYAQSFSKDDILYWLAHEPEFGRQAVFLDAAEKPADLPDAERLKAYREQGVRIVAPPLFALLAVDAGGKLVPSAYARNAKAAGLDIIAWSLERSGPLVGTGSKGFYYQGVGETLTRDGDVYRVLDVLARDIGIRGLFSDWPATVSFYANCMGLN